MLRFSFTILLILGLGSFASASTLEHLATISNDRNGNIQELSAVVEAMGDVSGINFDTRFEDGTKTSTIFSTEQIASGAVLERDGNHDAFILLGQIVGAGSAKNLTVRYLSNGLTDSYKECSVTLLKGADGNWALLNSYTNNVIQTISIVTWSLGIDTVQNICEE